MSEVWTEKRKMNTRGIEEKRVEKDGDTGNGTLRANGMKRKAFQAAFPYTVPIMAGFLFLGIAYGMYMNLSGFAPIYPILMSLLIYGGSMEFIAVSVLLSRFDPIGTFVLTLMVHARHIFYGISMLDKYKGMGWKKAYLIFGMCDETFSINCTAQIPTGVDRGWFYFFVTMLNHLYWVAGATLGGLFGSLLDIQVEGLEFVMTALLVVIFLDNWMKEKNHVSSLIGLGFTILCLVIFKSENFLIPSMVCILVALTLVRGGLEKKVMEEPGQETQTLVERERQEEKEEKATGEGRM